MQLKIVLGLAYLAKNSSVTHGIDLSKLSHGTNLSQMLFGHKLGMDLSQTQKNDPYYQRCDSLMTFHLDI